MYLSLPFYILSALGVAVAIASLGLPGTKNINRDHIDLNKTDRMSDLIRDKHGFVLTGLNKFAQV